MGSRYQLRSLSPYGGIRDGDRSLAAAASVSRCLQVQCQRSDGERRGPGPARLGRSVRVSDWLTGTGTHWQAASAARVSISLGLVTPGQTEADRRDTGKQLGDSNGGPGPGPGSESGLLQVLPVRPTRTVTSTSLSQVLRQSDPLTSAISVDHDDYLDSDGHSGLPVHSEQPECRPGLAARRAGLGPDPLASPSRQPEFK
jgi:hypothetical protein